MTGSQGALWSDAVEADGPDFPGRGWISVPLPGIDLLRLDLRDTVGLVPTVTLRRGSDVRNADAVDDPRGPLTEGRVIARDRWLGGAWFGWRFLSLVELPGGLAAPVLRWLLWSTASDRPVDPDRDVPTVDVAGSCSLRSYPLARTLMDTLVTVIPDDWAPARPSSPSGLFRRSPPAPAAPASRLRLDAVPASLPTVLSSVDPAEPASWRSPAVAGHATDLRRLEFLGEDGRPTDRGLTAAAALADPDGIIRLATWSGHGASEPLLVHRRGGAAVVQLRTPEPDSAAAGAGAGAGAGRARLASHCGLTPIEYAAETVTALVGLSAADTQAFEVSTVNLDWLVDRALNPTRPLPTRLSEDPLWAAAWSEHWTLWQLDAEQRDEMVAPAARRRLRPGLMVLTAGSAGSHRLFRDQQDPRQVVLTPWSGTEILAGILDQLGGIPTFPDAT